MSMYVHRHNGTANLRGSTQKSFLVLTFGFGDEHVKQ